MKRMKISLLVNSVADNIHVHVVSTRAIFTKSYPLVAVPNVYRATYYNTIPK